MSNGKDIPPRAISQPSLENTLIYERLLRAQQEGETFISWEELERVSNLSRVPMQARFYSVRWRLFHESGNTLWWVCVAGKGIKMGSDSDRVNEMNRANKSGVSRIRRGFRIGVGVDENKLSPEQKWRYHGLAALMGAVATMDTSKTVKKVADRCQQSGGRIDLTETLKLLSPGVGK